MSNESMVSVRDVAAKLNISMTTVYRLKDKKGGLPAYRVGGVIRFKMSEVESYLAAQAIRPANRDTRKADIPRFKYVPGMKVVGI